MQSGNDRQTKIQNFLSNPLGLMAVIVGLFFVILIIITVSILTTPNINENNRIVCLGVDPASGEEVCTEETGAGTNILYPGMSKISESGLSSIQYLALQNAAKKYAKEKEINLERVSYLKESFKKDVSYVDNRYRSVFSFSIVLNTDQETIHVEIDTSESYSNLLWTKIYFYDEVDEEIFQYILDEEIVCNEYDICDTGDR